MGYTHYWYKIKELDQTKFRDFMDDFETILPHFNNFLATSGDQALEIGLNLLYFNGIEEQSHETFMFTRVVENKKYLQYHNDDTKTHIFDFCKTAEKPYDIAVTSALIIAKKHFGDDIIISSDGVREEWYQAITLCEEKLGYGKTMNFDGKNEELQL